MASTVAVDAGRAEGWKREPRPEREALAGASHGEGIAEGHEPIVVPPWPRRRLNDALAGPAPGSAGGNVIAEPWSRANETSEHVVEPWPPELSGSGVPPPEPVNGAENSVVATFAANETAAPRRPLVEPADGDPDESFDPADPRRWGVVSLSEADATGNDIIRALAGFDSPAGAVAERTAPLAEEHQPDAEERPPMIIERALAAQRMGILTVPAPLRPSPVPALSVGFSLALLAGAALYLFLAAA